MTNRPPDQHPLTDPAIPHVPAPFPYAMPAWPTTSVVTVTARDLPLLPSCVAIDLTDVAYAQPIARGQNSNDHHWQWVATRREDGWTVLHEIDAAQSRDDDASRKLRQSLALEFVMLRVEDPVPHVSGQRSERVIAVHRYEVLPAQIRNQIRSGAGPAHTTDQPDQADQPDQSVEAALALASGQQAAVVVALTDGSRLNGVPQLSLPGSGTVLLREESGQEPFTVCLAHVMYVRALAVREG